MRVLKRYYVFLPLISVVSIALGIMLAGWQTTAAEEHSSLYREGLQHLYPYYVPEERSGGAALNAAYAAPVEGDDAAEKSYNFARRRLDFNKLGSIVFGTALHSISGLDPLLNKGGRCGIAAWECGGERWQALLTFSRIYDLNHLELQTQLLFVNFELNGLSQAEDVRGAYQDVYDDLKTADNFLLSLGFFMQNYLGQSPYDLTAAAVTLYGYEPEESYNEPEMEPPPVEPEPVPEPEPPEPPEPAPPTPPPMVIDQPTDAACSAGLSGGYIATTNATDQEGAYLVPLAIRQLSNNDGRTTTLVHRCLKRSVERLLADYNAQASADNRLGGWGWRSNQRQIELRRKHCGTSHYDIYEKSANECSPPTARPGYSSHQDGLAVDFYCKNEIVLANNCGGAFRWLECNAAAYGLLGLSSETWHWYYPLNKSHRLQEKINAGC